MTHIPCSCCCLLKHVWKHRVCMGAPRRQGQKEQFSVKGLLMGSCAHHCWMKCTDSSTLLGLILKINVCLARKTQCMLRGVNYERPPLFWQIALLSDADHWTVNLSICFSLCGISSFTPLHSFYQLITPTLHRIFHFSFDLAHISLILSCLSDSCSLYLNQWGWSEK